MQRNAISILIRLVSCCNELQPIACYKVDGTARQTSHELGSHRLYVGLLGSGLQNKQQLHARGLQWGVALETRSGKKCQPTAEALLEAVKYCPRSSSAQSCQDIIRGINQ